MSLAIKQPLPQIDNRITPAANESNIDVGRAAIAAMREMLGKTSAASLFDKLTAQQRALVFFAARLKPSEYLNRPLLSLSTTEREAVRQSLIALVDLGKTFNNMPLSRAQFISPKQTALSAPVSSKPNNEQVVNDELNRLAKQASELMSEFNHDNKH